MQTQGGGVEWITMALQTIPPDYRDLRQIAIFVPCLPSAPRGSGSDMPAMDDAVCNKWLDLDRFLAKFWEARSIRPRVVCPRLRGNWKTTVAVIGSLLKEITDRGIIDLVEIENLEA